jgi:PAS domain S-box-containing protein
MSNRAHATLLLLSDRTEDALALEVMAETLGLTFVTARSGAVALKCLEKQDVAGVLLDLHTCDPTGANIAGPIWEQTRTKALRLLFLCDPEVEFPTALGWGSAESVDFLRRPFTPAALRAKLEGLTAAWRARLPDDAPSVTCPDVSSQEHITDGFFALDRNWRITYISPEAARLFSRIVPPERTLLDADLWECFPHVPGTPAAAAFHRAALEQIPIRMEHFSVPHQTWFELRIIPSASGISVYFHDLTDQRRADEALRISEERFRAAAGAVSNLLWTNDAQGMMVGEQPGWESFTGQPPAEYLGYGWSQAVHPEDAQPTLDAWQKAVAERRPFVFEHRLRRHDGIWRLFSIRAVPIITTDGTIREWVGVHSDITERRQSELRQAFLIEIGDALRDLNQPQQIMTVAAELVGRHLGANRVGYGELNETGEFLVVEHDWTDGTMLTAAGWHRFEEFGAEVLAEHRAGRSVSIADALVDARTQNATAAYAGIGGVRARLAVPLIRGGRWVAEMFVHQAEPRAWTDDELALVREIAERTWAAVERARAEAAQRENEERLRLATDAARLGIWSWEIAEDRVSWENDQLFEIMGLAPTAEPINAARFLAEFVHPDDAAEFRRALDAAVRTGCRFYYVGRFYRADKALRWIEFTGRVQLAADGSSVRMVGTGEDITDRKRTEEQIREAAEINAKFRTMFEQGSQFAAILSLNGAVMEANRLYVDGCGFYREDVMGKKFWDCGWWNRSPALAELVRAAALQAAQGELFRAEIAYFLADGSERLVDLTLAPVLDDARQVLFVAATGTDITDRKRSDEALRKLAADLSEADRQKDEFLATLAHELRNPLGAISNALQVLRETGSDDPPRVRLRNLIDRQTRHLRRLVDDLLDVSRFNRGKFQLQREELELQPLITHVLETLQPGLAERGHTLQLSLPATALILDADPTRLEQVLWNLLHNAVKYTPPGGQIALSVEWDDVGNPARSAEFTPPQPEVRIRVRDNGIGIPQDLLCRIFDVFAQAEQSLARSQGGLGLGLTLVKQLVEMHGGVVEAHSAGLGQGAEFCVRLPILRLGVASSEVANSAVPPATQGLRILVVEDLIDAAETLGELLELWGHEVRLAHDGPAALSTLNTFSADVLLLDIGLPGMNGYEVATQLRARPGGDRPCVIALTGYGQPEDRRRTAECGFNHHLLKPVDLDELRKLLASQSVTARD